MHLLAVRPGRIDDGGEAVDIRQSPAEIVFLSAADTELATVAAAHARLGPGAPGLRVANILNLRHPMSVDLYVERTVARARIVVLRLLGGLSYWPYGVEELARIARERGVLFAALPGDDRPDEALARASTVAGEAYQGLWRYFSEGGIDNAAGALALAAHLVGLGPKPAGPRPLMPAGLYAPGIAEPAFDDVAARWTPGRPVAAIMFYRALHQSGQTATIDALIEALTAAGLDTIAIYAQSLKERTAADIAAALIERADPAIVVNATGFALSAPGAVHVPTVLDAGRRPVIQAILAGASLEAWGQSPRGLGPRDIAMNVALPEIDGRIISRAIAFKAEARFDAATEAPIVVHAPEPGRVRYVAELAAAWARLGATPEPERRVAIVLANYPNRDGRIGNGVGLDTPASAAALIMAMAAAGYDVGEAPRSGDELMRALLDGPTNAPGVRRGGAVLSLEDYQVFFAGLPQGVREAVGERWGAPADDPFVEGDAFCLSAHRFGNLAIAVQPARGYNIDPKATYHDPDLVPPHGYLAFHAWLRRSFAAHAVIQMGKHGNLEWLPGKALALSEACFPEAALGPVPLIYPFIVNDPGEGAQGKRRAAAVIVDHLTPPLARAETYGPLREIEALVDEYFEAAQVDPRRAARLKRDILDAAAASGLDRDCGIDPRAGDDDSLGRLDAHLCDLKELQIRDGLHVFGESPAGERLNKLLVALARVPRGAGEPGDRSLTRALAADLGLMAATTSGHSVVPVASEIDLPCNSPSPVVIAGLDPAIHTVTAQRIDRPAEWTPEQDAMGVGGRGVGYPVRGDDRACGDSRVTTAKSFDPLDCDLAALWHGPRPEPLKGVSSDPWRTAGDTVERLELIAEALVAGDIEAAPDWTATRAVLDEIETRLRPAVIASGPAETAATLAALAGRFVAPGPSGAPTRGRPEALPTGRNFYSLDSRAVPTEAAWALGQKSAALLVEDFRQRNGRWPQHMALSAWGTANMRTGGDDIAQALALVGVRPQWERASGRVTGFEVLPPAALGRPRVDVTFRVSGFFRDAFPAQIDLFDSAVRAVAALDEDEATNPIAARVTEDRARLARAGASAEDAARRAGYRVFSSMPGAYGAGLQALIDEGVWETRGDFADTYIAWSAFAYGAGAEGEQVPQLFADRLARIEAVVHNQDNREHDLLDSDDYYQFEGGLAAAVENVRGIRPAIYHNDHSRPERPVVRTLEAEIARVVRARAANPKWIEGVMRHGYKGAFEIAATVDYLYAFQATTGAVADHHFDLLFDAYLGDERVRAFIAEANPAALSEIAARFREALERGLWRPRSNSVYDLLDCIGKGQT